MADGSQSVINHTGQGAAWGGAGRVNVFQALLPLLIAPLMIRAAINRTFFDRYILPVIFIPGYIVA